MAELIGRQVRVVNPRFHPTLLENVCIDFMSEVQQGQIQRNYQRYLSDMKKDKKDSVTQYADAARIILVSISSATMETMTGLTGFKQAAEECDLGRIMEAARDCSLQRGRPLYMQT